MSHVNESQMASAAVVLLDGPMDGQRFKVPLLPPTKKVPDTIDLPLKQPAISSPYALCKLTSEEPVAGFFVYFFAGCSSPDGDGVLYAPDFVDVGADVSGMLDVTSQATDQAVEPV